METERVSASTTIESAPEAVFAVLANPSAHADIDGTGWVRGSLDGDRITAAGQVFRMAMYHENHPDKDYKIANRVEVFDEPRAIAWQPGQESPETGELTFGGWIWRYDLEATGPSRTTVTLTYDWWSQEGAATGMINYYRSSVRQSPKAAEAALRPISAPTLVIWGERDSYLGSELAEPEHDDVPNLDRVERLPDASHWVHHDEAERVTQLLIDFFGPTRPTQDRQTSTT